MVDFRHGLGELTKRLLHVRVVACTRLHEAVDVAALGHLTTQEIPSVT